MSDFSLIMALDFVFVLLLQLLFWLPGRDFTILICWLHCMQNCTVSLVAPLFLDLRFLWHWNKDFISTLLAIVDVLGSAAGEGFGVAPDHVVFNLTDCNILYCNFSACFFQISKRCIKFFFVEWF